MRGSNVHLHNVLLCKMNQRTRFNHISNFRRLVVAVVVRHRKKISRKICEKNLCVSDFVKIHVSKNLCVSDLMSYFTISLRLGFYENMRISDFRDPG